MFRGRSKENRRKKGMRPSGLLQKKIVSGADQAEKTMSGDEGKGGYGRGKNNQRRSSREKKV